MTMTRVSRVRWCNFCDLRLIEPCEAAFEGFLETYKTTKTKSAVDALLDMNIDDDDFSDEYDFIDSDDEAAQTRRAAQKQAQVPRKKYMEILQRVANRIEDEITIDLDDMAEVRITKNPNMEPR
jgi:DNA replication licensing factor MCM7